MIDWQAKYRREREVAEWFLTEALGCTYRGDGHPLVRAMSLVVSLRGRIEELERKTNQGGGGAASAGKPVDRVAVTGEASSSREQSGWTPDSAAAASFEDRVARGHAHVIDEGLRLGNSHLAIRDEIGRRLRAEDAIAAKDDDLSVAYMALAAKDAEIARMRGELGDKQDLTVAYMAGAASKSDEIARLTKERDEARDSACREADEFRATIKRIADERTALVKERDDAKRCLHVEMSMRHARDVGPEECEGPWRLEARLSLAEKVVEAAGKEPWIMHGQYGGDFEYGCEGCHYAIVAGRVVHGKDCLFAELRSALAAYRSAKAAARKLARKSRAKAKE